MLEIALRDFPKDDAEEEEGIEEIVAEVEESARDLGEKSGVFEHGRPNKMLNDYSADATLRSIEDSLKRLQTDRLDIVWIHDIAQDFYGDHRDLHSFPTRRSSDLIPEDEAQATVEAAWNSGVRYFDTAPFYEIGRAHV